MRLFRVLSASILVAFASPAAAKVQFAAYEGPESVQIGNGGAKTTESGVDFWTHGTPPRRYQILGFMTDSRADKRFSGNAIGSEGLAKRVLKLGGNALIVVDQNSRAAGMTGIMIPNGIGGANMVGRQVNSISTTFMVIRYLD